jgi:hypothetical protein
MGGCPPQNVCLSANGLRLSVGTRTQRRQRQRPCSTANPDPPSWKSLAQYASCLTLTTGDHLLPGRRSANPTCRNLRHLQAAVACLHRLPHLPHVCGVMAAGDRLAMVRDGGDEVVLRLRLEVRRLVGQPALTELQCRPKLHRLLQLLAAWRQQRRSWVWRILIYLSVAQPRPVVPFQWQTSTHKSAASKSEAASRGETGQCEPLVSASLRVISLDTGRA